MRANPQQLNEVPGIRVSGRATIDDAPLFGPLELDVGPGQWTCLLGPSGVGKSTLLRRIAGLETGVAFEGSVTATDGKMLPGRLAYMAQSDLLFPWLDVLGNVLLGPSLRGAATAAAVERARSLIERVGLAGDIAKRPKQLSGGMRQRVALARTLMEDRPVILLDEPFSALDARTRAEMQELAAELLAGRTILLVTHDPAEAARMSHSIVLMTEGGLTDVPPPATPPIRAYDDPAVFECQSQLMRLVREPA